MESSSHSLPRLPSNRIGDLLRVISDQSTIRVDKLFFLCTVRPKLSKRIRTLSQKLIMLVYTKLISLNLFPGRTFGSNIDRTRDKRYGRWATRLYILLLIIGLVILIFHTIIQPQVLRKTFESPSLDVYERLLLDHSEALQCPCSSISSTYDQCITIEPAFHPVTAEITR